MLLTMPGPSGSSRRPSLRAPTTTETPLLLPEAFSDARTHGYQGPTRHVRFPRASSAGVSAIAKREDGPVCAVAGRESLRLLRMKGPSESTSSAPTDHKVSRGRGGHCIEASRNYWDGSGLKIDSASTDVAWGRGLFENKIFTTARNGELIMWDINKSGPSKLERRTRDHVRSIHALSVSPSVDYYCTTGSADGTLLLWDIRDISKSVMKIVHTAAVRAIALSPISWKPMYAVTGLDNGSIFRWDFRSGQRGLLDRIPSAHGTAILSLDWTPLPSSPRRSGHSGWYSGASAGAGLLDDILPSIGSSGNTGAGPSDSEGGGEGWLASGGLDKCVKIWDFTPTVSKDHISHQPKHTLRTSFPVRRVAWRPGYSCELAVVSNANLAIGLLADMSHGLPGSSNSAAQSTVSGLVGSPILASPRIGTLTTDTIEAVNGKDDRSVSATRTDGSDAIEIWDVRRSYIAKWVVRGSAVEGGVTDVEFGDSHAIWAQQSSGTFSQLDLRNCSKPLDMVTRTAVTWDVTGTLAFVADRPKKWEIPYDDVNPDAKSSILDRQGLVKYPGDPPYAPTTQSLGTFSPMGAADDLESFIKIAQGSQCEGSDKLAICAHNAEIAAENGRGEVAQAWLMLESLLTDVVVERASPIPLSPLPIVSPPLPHSMSAPAAIPTVNSFQTLQPQPLRSVSTDADIRGKDKGSSPGSKSRDDGERLSTLSHSPHRITPTSSNASSPRRINSGLPPAATARRDSNAGLTLLMRPKLSSSLRRPSFATPSIHSVKSESPSDSTKSHSSLRHVGEGALDDSDSSGSEGEERYHGGAGSKDQSDDERPALHTPRSPYLYPRNGASTKSPLSHVVGQQAWTEDEKDDDDSPSPASSESESSDSSSINGVPNASRRASGRSSKSRSRSSTVASLLVSSQRPLAKKASQSSIRTVTIGAVVGLDSAAERLHREDTLRPDFGKAMPTAHHRTQSDALSSEFMLDTERNPDQTVRASNGSHISDKEAEPFLAAEQAYRELGWEALRDALESFADEGDIQTCALLSLIAPEELHIGKLRATRFQEAYIDMLTRLRLHTSAAYLRSNAGALSIRASTTLETTLYTSCGRCHKAIQAPVVPKPSAKPASGHFYCRQCKANASVCSICHLPVRTLMFQCTICMHGGHQECYRNYYMHRPMLELPTPVVMDAPMQLGLQMNRGREGERARGRAASRSESARCGIGDNDGSDEGVSPSHTNPESKAGSADTRGRERRLVLPSAKTLLGHPCAAGCGHYCWAANDKYLLR